MTERGLAISVSRGLSSAERGELDWARREWCPILVSKAKIVGHAVAMAGVELTSAADYRAFRNVKGGGLASQNPTLTRAALNSRLQALVGIQSAPRTLKTTKAVDFYRGDRLHIGFELEYDPQLVTERHLALDGLQRLNGKSTSLPELEPFMPPCLSVATIGPLSEETRGDVLGLLKSIQPHHVTLDPARAKWVHG